MPRRSKMMKKMKSMSAEAAAVRRLVLLSDEDDEPNRNDRTAQQEWNLLIHELSGSESDEERNDELMPISFVRKAFDHCLRFMHGYRSGLVGPVLEYAVVVLYCTYMHPYIYTVSRTTVQLLHRM